MMSTVIVFSALVVASLFSLVIHRLLRQHVRQHHIGQCGRQLAGWLSEYVTVEELQRRVEQDKLDRDVYGRHALCCPPDGLGRSLASSRDGAEVIWVQGLLCCNGRFVPASRERGIA